MPQIIKTTAMDIAMLDRVLGWAADEGWNPGIADAAAFHAADPDGFFVTTVDGAPVAAISVVNHTDHDAFLGLYICRPDWRGRGIGFATWTHALLHAGDRSIGLDGVPAQEANYRASGFDRVGASLRHEGRVAPSVAAEIRDVTPGDAAALVVLDAQANGFERRRFIEPWVASQSADRGTKVIDTGNGPAGFATWRACRSGTKIGPIVAADHRAALALLGTIAAARPNGPMIVDVPEANAPLRAQLTAQGFTVPFSTARMYRGAVPQTGPMLQAIATMELG